MDNPCFSLLASNTKAEVEDKTKKEGEIHNQESPPLF